MPLAAITSFYNPCQYRRRVHNYVYFRDRLLAQGVALLTIEHVLDGSAPQIQPTGELYLLVRGGDLMWQKERLLNLAVAHLPAHFDAVAWLDCDIFFLNPQWRKQAERLLTEYVVLQLFTTAINLPKDQTEYCGEGELLSSYVAGQRLGAVWGRMGLGWAARRDLLAKHGLYDGFIVGGADNYMLQAFHTGALNASMAQTCTAAMATHFQRWAAAVHNEIGGRIGCLPGALCHLWHGEREDRGYTTRHQILLDSDFDPAADLRLGESGAWQWTTDKRQLHQAVHKYFASRQEDGQDSEPALTRGIVSYADEECFASVQLLIQSARECLPGLAICIFGANLPPEQQQQLVDCGVEHRPFVWAPPPGRKPLSRHDHYTWLQPMMVARAPYRQVLWIDPEAVVLGQLDALFRILEREPILYTSPTADPVSNGELRDDRTPELAVNSAVVGIDKERDSTLLTAWTQLAWRNSLYPEFRPLMFRTLERLELQPTLATQPGETATARAWPPAGELGLTLAALRQSHRGVSVLHRRGMHTTLRCPGNGR